MVVEEILNADAGWLAALEKRGHRPDVGAGGAAVGGRRTTTPTRRAAGSCARSGSSRSTRRTTAGRTRSTGSSPTSTSPRAGGPDHRRRGAGGAVGVVGQLRRPRGAGAAARHPQADRDHPARGPVVHDRGQPGAVGQVGPADRVQRARGPHAAPGRVRRAADRLPGVRGRDGGAVRRPVAGAVLAELLRQRRVHARPRRRLAAAGLRLPRRHRLPRRRHRRRPRRAQDHPERHLHARGGLRRPLEALGPLHRQPRRRAASGAWCSPTSRRSATTTTASTGTSTSTARSSSRCKATGIVFTAGRAAPSTRRRSRPGSARRSTSTCSRRGWT